MGGFSPGISMDGPLDYQQSESEAREGLQAPELRIEAECVQVLRRLHHKSLGLGIW